MVMPHILDALYDKHMRNLAATATQYLRMLAYRPQPATLLVRFRLHDRYLFVRLFTTVDTFLLWCLAAYPPAAIRVARTIQRSTSISHSAIYSTFLMYPPGLFVYVGHALQNSHTPLYIKFESNEGCPRCFARNGQQHKLVMRLSSRGTAIKITPNSMIDGMLITHATY